MSDIERQLRESLAAAVEDAEPPQAVMDKVRRRHRRQNLRLLATWITVLVVVTIAALATVGSKQSPRPADRGPTPAARLFPGGGRILLARWGSLYWLYPDGRSTVIGAGYSGAILSGGELLASKPGPTGPSYYTMNLDGSDARLVLPAERSKQYFDGDVQLSPDGSRLAYTRQQEGQSAGELFAVNLATGQRADLGPGTAFAWRDNSAIVVSANARTLDLVNVSTGSRTTYLTLSDPRLIRAFERATRWPGPPTSISPDGWSPGGDPAVLAVSLTAFPVTSGPRLAEIIITERRVLAFAPPKSDALLSLTWGPDGVFLLQSGAGDDPASWNVYVGSSATDRLSGPFPYFHDAALFSPAGTVLAMEDNGIVTFVPVPAPACHLVGRCLRFPLAQLLGRGEILAWTA